MATGGRRATKNAAKGGGRRRNYEKRIEETGLQRWTPRGWANWSGAVMFAFVAIAVLVELFLAISDRRGADPVAAAVVVALATWMAILFARNRLED